MATIRTKSKKQAKKDNEIAKIKKALQPVCLICGREYSSVHQLQAAHLLPKSVYPEYYTLPENIGLMCGYPFKCHDMYDNDLSFRRKQKHVFNRVKRIDERAANKYFGFI